MEITLQAILKMLVEPPGNLIYHLVLAFSIVTSLQAAVISRQNRPAVQGRRMVFGLSMLLVGQVALFLSSGFAWQNVIDPRLLLPVLDRAVMVFCLVWIVWLWNFPAPAKLGDLVTGFLVLGVVVMFLFSYTAWTAEGQGQPFNNSTLDWGWAIGALFVTVTGMAVLLFSRPAGWGYGLGMLGLSMAGFLAHLLIAPTEGSFSGYIRLGQLAAYPLLTTLLHRFSTIPTAAPEPVKTAAEPAAGTARAERRRYSASARTVHAWLDLAAAKEPQQVTAGLARALSHTMLSDLCFLVSGPNYGHIVLQSGYDLIREEEMPGTMIEQGSLPALAGALQRGKPLRVTDEDSQPPDMKVLCAALGLTETGSLMFIPLTLDEKPQGGLLLLSPYANRQWTSEDQNYLSAELEAIARLARDAQRQGEQAGAGQAGAALAAEAARLELENLRRENRALLEEIEALQHAPVAGDNGQGALAPAAAVTPAEFSALVALQQESQEQIAALQAENERLQAALHNRGEAGVAVSDFEQMEGELRATLQELASLQNQLAGANARALALEREARPRGMVSNEEHEVITSIVQEIRQPMSSIMGYTDLLLAESVGILGALQRKFLERIKASTERMHGILNDLIQISMLGSGAPALAPKPVELGGVIDEAMTDTSAQLREKNITLQVDLPEEMPQILADHDAILQILLHLLQNAGSVTPQEGTVTLRARLQPEAGRDYLLLQVSDTGGGIAPEDLPRVFSRRYRANTPLVQGLGDTGVGLSIARTLVEAQNGRIWVDSLPGQATTFSVLLPVQPGSSSIGRE